MIGTVVDERYRVTSRIGSGGGGEVYEAEDLKLPRKVAIKFPSLEWADGARQRQRFLREAEALSLLDHPHICTIHTVGETEDGRVYIVMARYEGLDLRARIAEGGITLQEALSFGIAVADGMAQAHSKGVLHRDLKPGNVFITRDNLVKILDFGLAKLPDRTQMTEAGVAMGTLAYISPEQARGDELDLRTDIYSLGVVLYQIVTGVCPFAAPSAAATLQRVLNEEPEPLREISPGVPERLALLIEQMMSKDRDERPDDMAAIHDELLQILTDLDPAEATRILVEHVQSTEFESPRRKRLPIVFALAVGALIALFADDLWNMAFPPGPVTGRGVAVLPVSADGFGEARELLAAGLRLDLLDEIEHLADHDDALWGLPAWWPAGSESSTARRTSGVTLTLHASLHSDPDGPVLNVTLLDAETREEVASVSWVVRDSVPDVQAWIAETLGLDSENVWNGGTRDPQAWFAYLQGRGALGSRALDVDPLELFDEALSRDPDFLHARLQRAMALAATGEIDEARTELEAQSSLPGAGGAALGLLATLEYGQREYVRAAELFRQAIELRPGTMEYRTMLGIQHQMMGDLDLAEDAFRKAIEVRPDYPGAWEYLGYLFYSRQQYEEAIEAYAPLLEIAPDYSGGCNRLGVSYYAIDRWEEAFELFSRSFRLGRDFDSCSNLGTIYYMRGEFDRAAAMQELALEYRPQDARVMTNLAAALQWLPEQQARADSVLTEAIRLTEGRLRAAPDDPEIMASLAALVAERDRERANELALAALAIDKENAGVLYQAAMASELAGDRPRALHLLGRAIEAGYSRRVIENEKELEKLRDDSRYGHLIQ